ncbi:fumarate reductase cytochrome b subunit [Reinekea marinisedimentorum]|uniref:Fumarate reductase subunit C n=1 Tax=Reinekea marinisedimentorum TaxID=230495 RepID=A0A4R3IG95_9GAMM|nr:fumarate reductase cytochrome b subunit [Reinekea marinisedimentorum]TCS44032.1 fumarate reductase subunit C [Reinekea marinisedimentorum]
MIIGTVDLGRPTRLSAWMDIVQGVTGLFLVVFMWAHMFLVSSILLGKDAMYFVTRLFEGELFFGRAFPQLVSMLAFFILTVLFVHAFLALRRFPTSANQYRSLHRLIQGLKHKDTTLWYAQVLTGFILFFLASVHLYQLISHPGDIGPYATSDRIYSERMWPLYLIMLFVVELHAGAGIYRLVMKWGIFLDSNPKTMRTRLRKIKWLITVFFIVLGLLTLGAYMKIGHAHQDAVSQRYHPAIEQSL